MKKAIAIELEKEHNVYIDAELEIYTTGERDDEAGWMPIPDSWIKENKMFRFDDAYEKVYLLDKDGTFVFYATYFALDIDKSMTEEKMRQAVEDSY